MPSALVFSAEIPLPPARSRKRKVRPDDESSGSDDERGGRRKDKGKGDGSKGLRHLTKQVCDKVKSKRTTTYREVANELVEESVTGGTDEATSGEQKTVRRRVYDALNVLMAMGIIAKDKKEIRWIGLPNAREELESLQKEKIERETRIAQKRELVKELEAHKKLYRNLAARNLHAEQQSMGEQGEEGGASGAVAERISLPFLIIHTKAGADISCEMTDDRTQYTFTFNKPFEIHQESQIIKDMALPDTTMDDDDLWNFSAPPASASASNSSHSSSTKFDPASESTPPHRHGTRSQSHRRRE